jgi:hypothetical protein
MKRVSLLLLLVVSSFAWRVPARAQIFRGPDAEHQAQKAAKKNQKTANKAARKQEKALQKAAKKQRKAMQQAAKVHR